MSMEVTVMIRMTTGLTLLALATILPVGQASAQNNTLGGALLGGAIGAGVGAAATGRAGGAVAGGVIGAAAGAMLGSQLEPRHSGYYWYKGRCWIRRGDGNYYRVSSRHCD
jgi:outer membrane lipoprotein SlyB